MRLRRVFVGWILALACLTGRAQPAPDRFSDEDFAALIPRLSGDAGAFPVENFVSNERSFQVVIPRLREQVRPGGVYIGVGPEQNFTFINAVRPALVFIIDIRRQNLLEHLMYKLAFEASATRADFLSYIFARPRPPNLAANTDVTTMLRAYLPIDPSKSLRISHEDAAIASLHARFPGLLNDKDDTTLKHLYSTFYEGGPLLTYVGPRPPVTDPGRRGWATMATLLSATDDDGRQQSYLASEDRFLFVKHLQERNLIVPVVGDFAGPKAIRAVGEYLRSRHLSVTAFYCSNVEQYLFRDSKYKAFYDSVTTLPLDDTSVFIRAFDKMTVRMSAAASPSSQAIPEIDEMLAPMKEFLAAYAAGKIKTYDDIKALSK
ncbi:MAG TPA: hypothetical protein VJN96_09810 [Vicinamibacterales bacterium]|nr:hypothetical protein [Vicinamibacterales bacterium]